MSVPSRNWATCWKLFCGVHDAGRVAGIAVDEGVGVLKGAGEGVKVPVQVLGEGYQDGFGSDEGDEVGVEGVGGLRDDDSVAGVDEAEEGAGEPPGPTVADEDLVGGVATAGPPGSAFSDGRSELRQTVLVGVEGLTPLDGGDASR